MKKIFRDPGDSTWTSMQTNSIETQVNYYMGRQICLFTGIILGTLKRKLLIKKIILNMIGSNTFSSWE